MGTRVKCNKCDDVIESKHRHDFVRCKCKAIFVDGGGDYLRIGGNLEDLLIEQEDGSFNQMGEFNEYKK